MSAWLTADWPAPPGVHALTTTRHGLGVSREPFDDLNLGIRNGDDPEAVTANRAALAEALGLPSPPHWLRQVHGIDVVRLHAPPPSLEGGGQEGVGGMTTPHPNPPLYAGEGESIADAAVTAVPGIVLAILTADCLPVVLAARDGSEIAAAHAGWRGLCAGVLEATVAAMTTVPHELIAWLGPAAGPQAYDVDAPVREAFLAADPQSAAAFVATRPGHWLIDLYAIARMRLAAGGIAPAAIHGGGLCTISDRRRFFSHRRASLQGSARTGRMATLAWMRP